MNCTTIKVEDADGNLIGAFSIGKEIMYKDVQGLNRFDVIDMFEDDDFFGCKQSLVLTAVD